MRGFYRLFYLFFLVLISSCANIVMPTGGDRDAEPPKAVASYPGMRDTAFRDNKIAIKFNEYVEWNNPNQNIIISPFIDGEIITKIHGKTVFVQPSTGFLPNKTYTIQLNNAVKDYHEGNLLPEFSLRFATGSQLDSSNVQVQVKNIEKEDATEALVVFCKEKIHFFDKKYDYISLATKGITRFDNLDAKSYYVFAFLDSNSNKKWDENERVGFVDQKISRKDTLNEMLLFPQMIKKNTALADNFQFGSFDLNFVQSLKNLEIISPRIQSVFMHSKKYKILFSPLENAGKLIFKVDGIQDTIEYKANEKKVDFEWVGYDRSRETEKMRFDSVEIQWNAKISKVDFNKITLKKDTTTVKLNGFIEGDKWMLTNLEPNSNYTLIIDSGALFASKFINKKMEYTFATIEKNQIREAINIKVEGNTKDWIAEVLVNKKRMFFDVSQNPVISLKNVTNSTLSFVFFYDKNKNGKWDSGDVRIGLQPEKLIRKELKLEGVQGLYTISL
jgi:hypothetical protein